MTTAPETPLAIDTSKLTRRAANFIAANQQSPVVFGQALTTDRRPVLTRGDHEKFAYLRYRLQDDLEFTLDRADMAGLRAQGVQPRWKGLTR